MRYWKKWTLYAMLYAVIFIKSTASEYSQHHSCTDGLNAEILRPTSYLRNQMLNEGTSQDITKNIKCIVTNGCIFDLIHDTKCHCLGSDVTVTFYLCQNGVYTKTDVVSVDMEAFDDVIMRYDDWILVGEDTNDFNETGELNDDSMGKESDSNNAKDSAVSDNDYQSINPLDSDVTGRSSPDCFEDTIALTDWYTSDVKSDNKSDNVNVKYGTLDICDGKSKIYFVNCNSSNIANDNESLDKVGNTKDSDINVSDTAASTVQDLDEAIKANYSKTSDVKLDNLYNNVSNIISVKPNVIQDTMLTDSNLASYNIDNFILEDSNNINNKDSPIIGNENENTKDFRYPKQVDDKHSSEGYNVNLNLNAESKLNNDAIIIPYEVKSSGDVKPFVVYINSKYIDNGTKTWDHNTVDGSHFKIDKDNENHNKLVSESKRNEEGIYDTENAIYTPEGDSYNILNDNYSVISAYRGGNPKERSEIDITNEISNNKKDFIENVDTESKFDGKSSNKAQSNVIDIPQISTNKYSIKALSKDLPPFVIDGANNYVYQDNVVPISVSEKPNTYVAFDIDEVYNVNEKGIIAADVNEETEKDNHLSNLYAVNNLKKDFTPVNSNVGSSQEGIHNFNIVDNNNKFILNTEASNTLKNCELSAEVNNFTTNPDIKVKAPNAQPEIIDLRTNEQETFNNILDIVDINNIQEENIPMDVPKINVENKLKQQIDNSICNYININNLQNEIATANSEDNYKEYFNDGINAEPTSDKEKITSDCINTTNSQESSETYNIELNTKQKSQTIHNDAKDISEIYLNNCSKPFTIPTAFNLWAQEKSNHEDKTKKKTDEPDLGVEINKDSRIINIPPKYYVFDIQTPFIGAASKQRNENSHVKTDLNENLKSVLNPSVSIQIPSDTTPPQDRSPFVYILNTPISSNSAITPYTALVKNTSPLTKVTVRPIPTNVESFSSKSGSIFNIPELAVDKKAMFNPKQRSSLESLLNPSTEESSPQSQSLTTSELSSTKSVSSPILSTDDMKNSQSSISRTHLSPLLSLDQPRASVNTLEMQILPTPYILTTNTSPFLNPVSPPSKQAPSQYSEAINPPSINIYPEITTVDSLKSFSNCKHNPYNIKKLNIKSALFDSNYKNQPYNIKNQILFYVKPKVAQDTGVTTEYFNLNNIITPNLVYPFDIYDKTNKIYPSLNILSSNYENQPIVRKYLKPNTITQVADNANEMLNRKDQPLITYPPCTKERPVPNREANKSPTTYYQDTNILPSTNIAPLKEDYQSTPINTQSYNEINIPDVTKSNYYRYTLPIKETTYTNLDREQQLNVKAPNLGTKLDWNTVHTVTDYNNIQNMEQRNYTLGSWSPFQNLPSPTYPWKSKIDNIDGTNYAKTSFSKNYHWNSLPKKSDNISRFYCTPTLPILTATNSPSHFNSMSGLLRISETNPKVYDTSTAPYTVSISTESSNVNNIPKNDLTIPSKTSDNIGYSNLASESLCNFETSAKNEGTTRTPYYSDLKPYNTVKTPASNFEITSKSYVTNRNAIQSPPVTYKAIPEMNINDNIPKIFDVKVPSSYFTAPFNVKFDNSFSNPVSSVADCIKTNPITLTICNIKPESPGNFDGIPKTSTYSNKYSFNTNPLYCPNHRDTIPNNSNQFTIKPLLKSSSNLIKTPPLPSWLPINVPQSPTKLSLANNFFQYSNVPNTPISTSNSYYLNMEPLSIKMSDRMEPVSTQYTSILCPSYVDSNTGLPTNYNSLNINVPHSPSNLCNLPKKSSTNAEKLAISTNSPTTHSSPLINLSPQCSSNFDERKYNTNRKLTNICSNNPSTLNSRPTLTSDSNNSPAIPPQLISIPNPAISSTNSENTAYFSDVITDIPGTPINSKLANKFLARNPTYSIPTININQSPINVVESQGSDTSSKFDARFSQNSPKHPEFASTQNVTPFKRWLLQTPTFTSNNIANSEQILAPTSGEISQAPTATNYVVKSKQIVTTLKDISQTPFANNNFAYNSKQILSPSSGKFFQPLITTSNHINSSKQIVPQLTEIFQIPYTISTASPKQIFSPSNGQIIQTPTTTPAASFKPSVLPASEGFIKPSAIHCGTISEQIDAPLKKLSRIHSTNSNYAAGSEQIFSPPIEVSSQTPTSNYPINYLQIFAPSNELSQVPFTNSNYAAGSKQMFSPPSEVFSQTPTTSNYATNSKQIISPFRDLSQVPFINSNYVASLKPIFCPRSEVFSQTPTTSNYPTNAIQIVAPSNELSQVSFTNSNYVVSPKQIFSPPSEVFSQTPTTSNYDARSKQLHTPPSEALYKIPISNIDCNYVTSNLDTRENTCHPYLTSNSKLQSHISNDVIDLYTRQMTHPNPDSKLQAQRSFSNDIASNRESYSDYSTISQNKLKTDLTKGQNPGYAIANSNLVAQSYLSNSLTNPVGYPNKVNSNDLTILKNKLKTDIADYINNILQTNLYNQSELDLPMETMILANSQPNVTIINNPGFGLTMWDSHFKIVEAKLCLKLKDLRVNNFMPVVKSSSNCNLDFVREYAKKYVANNYGAYILANKPYSNNNERIIINDNVCYEHCNILWPEYYY